MAKRVFFSFHHDDVKSFRANVVRQHWVTKDRVAAGFFDASIWEATKKEGAIAIKRLINKGLNNTTNTCVLIGSDTFVRPWVRYEIFYSMKKGNHIFGTHINGIRDKNKETKNLGKNPFKYLGIKYSDDGCKLTMYEFKQDNWMEFREIESNSSYSIRPVNNFKRGKFFKLSQKYKTYMWNKDKGYENFASWVK